MTTRDLHPLATDYLSRLRRAGSELPPERLRELSAEIEIYLSEAIAPDASDEQALEVLERLGPVGEIVEAEQVPAPVDRRGWREWAAVILLPLGGFAFGVGWLVGLALLWGSRLWTTREKLIGTLIVPGGIATALVFVFLTGTKRRCQQFVRLGDGAISHAAVRCTPSSGPGAAVHGLEVALVLLLVLAPIAAAVYLARRARSAPARLA